MQLQELARQAFDRAREVAHELVDESVAAIVSVEDDTRFLSATLQQLARGSALPGLLIIANCSQRHSESAEFEQRVRLQHGTQACVRVRVVTLLRAKSFGDAVRKACDKVGLPASVQALWLLHDDSRPADMHCLDVLIDAWHNTPTAALFGAKQLNWSGTRLQNVGFYAHGHGVVSLNVDGEPDQEQYDGRQDVYAVSLSGALVPVSTMQRLQGTNRWYTTYGESIDFSRRVCQSGGRVVIVPQAKIAHRRARFEGVRTHRGQVHEGERLHHTLQYERAAHRFRISDTPMLWWVPLWGASLVFALGRFMRLLARKEPYAAWCALVLPWLDAFDVLGAVAARAQVRKQRVVSAQQLALLRADRQQLAQFHDRKRAFLEQRWVPLLNPLAREHLRRRFITRYAWMALSALLATACAWYLSWRVLGVSWGSGSLYSAQLTPTGASLKQLYDAATTSWIAGVGDGVAAAPAPWLLVLLALSVLTGGNVALAQVLLLAAAPALSVMAFWALAGVVTRSDAVRCFSALVWFALSVLLGCYAGAQLAMLTIFIALPYAVAMTCRAIGKYRTERHVRPHASVQAGAAAALGFIPVVASAPQLIVPLLVMAAVLALGLHRRRFVMAFIAVPSLVVLAPTLLQVVAQVGISGGASGGAGGIVSAWRMLCGMIAPLAPSAALPIEAVSGITAATAASGGSALAASAAGLWGWQLIAAALQANFMPASQSPVLAALLIVACAIIGVGALAAWAKTARWQVMRVMWLLAIMGLALAQTAALLTNTLAAALPGIVLLALAALLCCCVAASADLRLRDSSHALTRGLLAALKSMHGVAVAAWCACLIAMIAAIVLGAVPYSFMGSATGANNSSTGSMGMNTTNTAGARVADEGLPAVAQAYLAQDEGRRMLALEALAPNQVAYALMRTGVGDLIDTSPAWRQAPGANQATEPYAQASAQLLAGMGDDAIASLQRLGVGGVYVVNTRASDAQEAQRAMETHIAASQFAQLVVANASGRYYRFTQVQDDAIARRAAAQRHAERQAPRLVWLAASSVTLLVCLLLAVPRRQQVEQYARGEVAQ